MTMNEIRVKKLLKTIKTNMNEFYQELGKVKGKFISGEITANQAKRIYIKTINRVNFYNHLRAKLTTAYPSVGELFVILQTSDFEEYIKFFEW